MSVKMDVFPCLSHFTLKGIGWACDFSTRVKETVEILDGDKNCFILHRSPATEQHTGSLKEVIASHQFLATAMLSSIYTLGGKSHQ